MSVTIDGVDELETELEKAADRECRRIAESWRRKTLEQIQGADQGADGLAEFVTEVAETENGFGFTIDHPVAVLHEFGGNIRLNYQEAKMMGYSRDDYYEALQDCEREVSRKAIVRKARSRVRNVE